MVSLRSGQLEARERLLGEMESKARERVEAAEIESYRLKGRGQDTRGEQGREGKGRGGKRKRSAVSVFHIPLSLLS